MLLIRHGAVLACGLFALFTPQTAAAVTAASSLTLQWMAPGDDGMVGRASQYDLRYSTTSITSANFSSATRWAGTPVPTSPGTTQSTTVTGLLPNTVYWFAMKAGDEIPNWSVMSNVVSSVSMTTGVGDHPLTLEFSQPWPNPARESILCAFTLPEPAMVQVDVFDVAGRHLRTLVSGWHDAGHNELGWNLRDDSGHPVGAGVYLVRARLGAAGWTRRVVVTR